MKPTLFFFLFCLIGFTGCKKHTDSNNNKSPVATLTMTVDSVPYSFTSFGDTLVIQLDTEIGGAYSNPVQFSIPCKSMAFIVQGSDGSQMVWHINDYNQPVQGTCLRTAPFAFNGSSNDYATAFGTKFYSGFSLSYYINATPHRYFNASGGNITITNCNETNRLISGSFIAYTDNHDYPTEHHVLQGTFTNIPYTVTTINHYSQNMAATVNGTSWTANGISTVIGKTQDFGILNKGFHATGVSINDNSEIDIAVFDAKNGNQGDCIRTITFLDYKRSTDTLFSHGYALVSNTLVNYITPDGNYANIDSAMVHITSCDEANRLISGTFNYYGKTTSGTKSVVITNGTFTNLHFMVN